MGRNKRGRRGCYDNEDQPVFLYILVLVSIFSAVTLCTAQDGELSSVSFVSSDMPEGDAFLLPCVYRGIPHLHGSSWDINDCTTCTCINSTTECVIQGCQPATCVDVIHPPGECCPLCPYIVNVSSVEPSARVISSAKLVPKRKNVLKLNVSVIFRETLTSTGVSGENLWNMTIWTSKKPDGSGVAYSVKKNVLTPAQRAQTYRKGKTFPPFTNIKYQLDARPDVTCSQMKYICAQFEQADRTEHVHRQYVPFLFAGYPNSDALTGCTPAPRCKLLNPPPKEKKKPTDPAIIIDESPIIRTPPPPPPVTTTHPPPPETTTTPRPLPTRRPKPPRRRTPPPVYPPWRPPTTSRPKKKPKLPPSIKDPKVIAEEPATPTTTPGPVLVEENNYPMPVGLGTVQPGVVTEPPRPATYTGFHYGFNDDDSGSNEVDPLNQYGYFYNQNQLGAQPYRRPGRQDGGWINGAWGAGGSSNEIGRVSVRQRAQQQHRWQQSQAHQQHRQLQQRQHQQRQLQQRQRQEHQQRQVQQQQQQQQDQQHSLRRWWQHQQYLRQYYHPDRYGNRQHQHMTATWPYQNQHQRVRSGQPNPLYQRPADMTRARNDGHLRRTQLGHQHTQPETQTQSQQQANQGYNWGYTWPRYANRAAAVNQADNSDSGEEWD